MKNSTVVFIVAIIFGLVLQSCGVAPGKGEGAFTVVYTLHNLKPGTIIDKFDVAERQAMTRPANACKSLKEVIGHQATFGIASGKNIYLYDLDGGQVHANTLVAPDTTTEAPAHEKGIIIVAVVNIGQGLEVKASDVEERDLPVQFMPDDAAKSVQAVVGKKAMHDFAKGDVLCTHDLYPN